MSKSTEELRLKLSELPIKTEYEIPQNSKTPVYYLRPESTDAIMQLFDQELAKRVEESTSIKVAGKKIEFSHTAVNLDMHLFIDGEHDPDVCPECIKPGLLVDTPTRKDKGEL